MSDTETVGVAPAPRSTRRLTVREQRQATVARVLEHFKTVGSLPSTLREQMIDDEHALRAYEGRLMPREAVERHVDQWAADLLSKTDREASA